MSQESEMPSPLSPPLTLAEYKAQLVTIPAGTFIRGSDERLDEQPLREIYLSAFQIGAVPVTVAMFQEFVRENSGYKSARAERAGELPVAPSKYVWQGCWETVSTHPMVLVTWDDAVAYAEWAGMALPTEAQWERAARGTDGREFPWGDEWDPSKCCSTGDRSWLDNEATVSVGSYPAGKSPEGVLDMAGNVWEWCADWYEEGYYAIAPENNPRGPETGETKVLRGGGWTWGVPDLFRCASRTRQRPPRSWGTDIGFRLAMAPTT